MIMSNYYFFHRGNYYVYGQLLFFIEVTTMIMSNYYFFYRGKYSYYFY